MNTPQADAETTTRMTLVYFETRRLRPRSGKGGHTLMERYFVVIGGILPGERGSIKIVSVRVSLVTLFGFWQAFGEAGR